MAERSAGRKFARDEPSPRRPVSWYITLVTNTEAYPEAPTSWKALWDPANADRIGLLALVSNSFLLEITAARDG